MVKIEEYVESDDSSDAEIIDESAFRAACTGLEPSSGTVCRMEELDETTKVDMDKRSSLQMMDFSEEEIEMAINRSGENAPLEELVNFIVASQAAGSSGEVELNGSHNCVDGRDEETTGETLHDMDKMSYLLQMGFSEDEIARVIDNLGPEVPIDELADSIFAQRLAYSFVSGEEDRSNDHSSTTILQDQNGSACQHDATLGETTERPLKRCYPASEMGNGISTSSKQNLYDSKSLKERENCKRRSVHDKVSSSCKHSPGARRALGKGVDEAKPSSYNKLNGLKEAAHRDQMTTNSCQACRYIPPGPPYFFYGNVVEISQEMWSKLSQFLYQIEPEYVNTQFFSALIRKEGYIHNLPSDKRFHVIPTPPMTISDALPHTKEWWPSWDARKKLSCVSTETKGSEPLCERLGNMLTESRGMPSYEQILDILHQCKTMSLMWVGQNKLGPIEPEQVERILGYSKYHTDIWEGEPSNRLKALKYGFQTDTLGYYLSGLKDLYPDGLRVLSIYTGIGGAEVALDKLGIHLKLVISVEAAETNRRILKRWWHNSGQSGILEQIQGIERLTTKKLEGLVEKFGGFDVIIGSNTCNAFEGPKYDSLEGIDLQLFFEFVRVVQRVRGLMQRNT